ncbi:DedA family protein [Corallincola luteus]|uniref:DedA family protein n=1 Tax=Corallincola luteus TaxID=1775177 RepID=UPI0013F428C7|nr:DedA family protein [Corallincola luteus]
MFESSFAFLPLPGDSLLFLAGGLVGLGVLGAYPTFIVLPLAAGFGSLVAYEQGRLLRHTSFIDRVYRLLPQGSAAKAHDMLNKHGLLALFISRFMPFVRVLTPMLMGAEKISRRRFFVVSLLSAWLWVLLFSVAGWAIVASPFYEAHQGMINRLAVLIPVFMFVVAVIAIVLRLIVNRAVKVNDKQPAPKRLLVDMSKNTV